VTFPLALDVRETEKAKRTQVMIKMIKTAMRQDQRRKERICAIIWRPATGELGLMSVAQLERWNSRSYLMGMPDPKLSALPICFCASREEAAQVMDRMIRLKSDLVHKMCWDWEERRPKQHYC